MKEETNEVAKRDVDVRQKEILKRAKKGQKNGQSNGKLLIVCSRHSVAVFSTMRVENFEAPTNDR